MIGQAGQPQPKGQASNSNRQGAPRAARLVCFIWIALALALLVLPFNRGGLWDPYELRIAELARRLAHQLFGAHAALGGAEPTAFVTAQQIGQGELAVTSPALGFALFGVSAWAGRITSLFWGAATVVSLWILMGRLASRFAQVAAGLFLLTLPVFVWQSRSMLGDAPTMGTLALSTVGLTLLRFDPVQPLVRTYWRWQLLFWGMSLIGLAAGLLCRGVLTGIAVPALSVALVALAQPKRQQTTPRESAITAALLAVGLVATSIGLHEAMTANKGFSLLLGVTLAAKTAPGSFDLPLTHVLHQAFPLSAFLPVAIVIALRPTSSMRTVASGANAPSRGTPSGDRIVASVFAFTALFSLVVSAILATRGVTVAFPAVAALAALAGVAIARWQRGEANSALTAGAVVTVAVLLFSDYVNVPTKVLEIAGVIGARFPDSFDAENRYWQRAALATLVLGGALVALSNRDRSLIGVNLWTRWRQLLERLRAAFGGQLLSGFVLVETALVTTSLLQRAHDRGWFVVPAFDSARLLFGPLLTWIWIVPPSVVFVVPFGYVAIRNFVEWLFLPGWGRSRFGAGRFGRAIIFCFERWIDLERLRLTPAIILTVALATSGALMSTGHAMAMAEQLSPKRAIRQFRARAAHAEPLGLLGIKAESVAYELGTLPLTFHDIEAGANWLNAAGMERRWLALDAEHLAELNGAYRAASGLRNLVIVDPPSSSVVLATNRLVGSERDSNPLSRDIQAQIPSIAHRATIEFGSVLRLVGWDIQSESGASVSRLIAGRSYELRLAFQVTGTTNVDWQVFVHLDGQGRRHNGDHDPVMGRYPTTLWQPGDVVIDRHEMVLERGALPGTHTLYFGLFRGNKRLDVSLGNHEDNRVKLGDVEVVSAT